MAFFRHLPAYLLALALLLVAGAHLLAAWIGWSDRFGPLVAMAALGLSLFGGLNAFGIVGAFFFAVDALHWPYVESGAFAAVGLLFASRGMIKAVFTMLTIREPDH